MPPRRLLPLVLATALALPGCCSLARGLCPVEQALETNTLLTRDTPDEALDYLVEAFEDRRIADIYNSLHPDFRDAHGGFSLAEFTSAFDEYEDLFRQDAGNLKNARRQAARYSVNGLLGGIRVDSADGTMGAIVVFKRVDKATVKRVGGRIPGSEAVIQPIGSMIQAEDGLIMPTLPVKFAGMGDVDPHQIVRLEYRVEWLVYELRDVHGVRFVERLEDRF